MTALDEQVDGDHYKGGAIQPFELTHRNGHDGTTHAVQKYLTRHPRKHGILDLQKAIHIVAIRAQLIEEHGDVRPAKSENPLDIEEYIESNGITGTNAACVRMVEAWHDIAGLDNDDAKMCLLIQKRIGELIAEQYPEGGPS
jgi:hypothetical protein